MELTTIKQEVELELTNKENVGILVATTFKGLSENTMKRALIEGMMRGFTFKDFLEKNIYAIPFNGGYSLITSVDYARKVGMRSGIVGKQAPVFVEQEGKIISCEVTVKRSISGFIGEFTSLVYFDEYFKAGSAGKPSLWETKPHTMIAKVAEMHALRMACPEELAQSYIEEEIERETTSTVSLNMDSYTTKIQGVKDIEELKRVWSALPAEAKTELVEVKDAVKEKLTPKVVDVECVVEPDTSDVTAEEIAEMIGGKVVDDESLVAKSMHARMKKAQEK